MEVKNQVEIKLPQVFNMAYATKEDKVGLVTKISFEVVNLHPAIEAQIKYIQAQHAPINVVFGSTGVAYQLRFDSINTSTGEVSGYDVTLSAGGKSVTMTDEEFKELAKRR